MEKKIFKKLRKHWLETVFITISVVLAIISLTIFKNIKSEPSTINAIEVVKNNQQDSDKIFVDVSGSVNSPGLYEASYSSRLKNLVDLAGGLSDTADYDFFARNFNLAQIVSDQDKIYIPSVWEVSIGYFLEGDNLKEVNNQLSKININEATLEELDTLPSVGKVTAQKIIDNRPYGALQELIDKKVVSDNLLEKLQDLIEV